MVTGDAEIRELNRSWRQIDRPTNVLAFSMMEGEFSTISPGLLGDLVISSETAENEASEAGISFGERMSQLLVHGILHLVGFDHEAGPDDAGKMEAKSIELLRVIEPNTNLEAF